MNRYLTKRHYNNRINYYRLALYILAPKVLLISSYFFSGRRNLRLDPHRVIFSPYCFSIVLFFRQFYNPNYVVYMVVLIKSAYFCITSLKSFTRKTLITFKLEVFTYHIKILFKDKLHLICMLDSSISLVIQAIFTSLLFLCVLN